MAKEAKLKAEEEARQREMKRREEERRKELARAEAERRAAEAKAEADRLAAELREKELHRPWGCNIPLAYIVNRRCWRLSRENPLFDPLNDFLPID